MPAEAGIHLLPTRSDGVAWLETHNVGPRFRGDDGVQPRSPVIPAEAGIHLLPTRSDGVAWLDTDNMGPAFAGMTGAAKITRYASGSGNPSAADPLRWCGLARHR